MPGLVPLALFLMTLTFFVTGYFISATFYQKKHDVKYSFTRMFPYEFNYPSTFKGNIYGNICFIIAMLSNISFYIYNVSISGNNSVTNIVMTVASVVMAALILCLFFLPLQFLRMHMMISTVAMTLAMGLPALACFSVYAGMKVAPNDQKWIYILAISVGALLALTMLVFIFNPKATYKIYLDKSVDKDGNEVMMRPKFIPIAFNEWWAIFTYVLSTLPLLIINFIK